MFVFISLHFSCYSCHSCIRQKQFHLQVIYFVKHCNTMIYDVFTINLQNVSCYLHEPKKAGFLPFFHIGQSCRNSVSPSVQPKGLTASLFLRVFFGFSSGWHSFPILVVERVAARINQVVECPAAVMVAKTVVDGFVSDKSVFVCRHDGICLKGFVLLWVFVSQKYTTICAIYLRR